MSQLTTDDLVQVVRRYFNSESLSFVTEKITYEDMPQTRATLMLNTVVIVSGISYDFGFNTAIRMHGYWKGKVSGHQWDSYDSSKGALVEIMDGEDVTTQFNVTNKQNMLDTQLPKFLALKRMALPQGISAPPVNRKDWAILLKRLADLLDNDSI